MKNKLFILGLMSVLAGCTTTPAPAPTPIGKTTLSETPLRTPVPTVTQSSVSNTIKAQQKEEKLKTEYDFVLLALLDSSKQKGDPDYLKNAHKMAQTVIVPTFKQSEQKIILEHAVMRHNQANYHGFYYPDFPQWLRTELKEAQKINTHPNNPTVDFQNYR